MKEYRCPKCKKLLFRANREQAIKKANGVFVKTTMVDCNKFIDTVTTIEVKCHNCKNICYFEI